MSGHIYLSKNVAQFSYIFFLEDRPNTYVSFVQQFVEEG